MKAAIYKDNHFGSELTGFNVMKVRCVQSARVISAPVETGVKTFDNKVIDPEVVIVTGIIQNKGDGTMESVVDDLDEMFFNRNFEFYSVADGFDAYDNLILQEVPRVRETDKYDFIQMELKFIEAMFIQSKKESPANNENTDTRNTGYQSGTGV